LPVIRELIDQHQLQPLHPAWFLDSGNSLAYLLLRGLDRVLGFLFQFMARSGHRAFIARSIRRPRSRPCRNVAADVGHTVKPKGLERHPLSIAAEELELNDHVTLRREVPT
jgi:hypothetical protein